MSSSWAKGSTRQWRRVRARVLARDEWLCRLQIPGICTTAATHVHHTKGRAVTGDDPAFLVAACQACNLHVGDPTARRHDPPARPITKW